jgi:hypothetical protein
MMMMMMMMMMMIIIIIIIQFNSLFFNNNMPLLRYTVKHLFYIPRVLVVWRRTASQTGAFTAAFNTKSNRNQFYYLEN